MAKKKKTIRGTVTINLDDYTLLTHEFEDALELREELLRASTELEIFLSYICTRIDILPFVEKYNFQSTSSSIILEDGKAKIKFRNNL
tara:strand:- start:96 stop:359 length:264 start_codon:yes stop_codon:yes gene_type:complete